MYVLLRQRQVIDLEHDLMRVSGFINTLLGRIVEE